MRCSGNDVSLSVLELYFCARMHTKVKRRVSFDCDGL